MPASPAAAPRLLARLLRRCPSRYDRAAHLMIQPRKWTEEDDQCLLELRAAGKTPIVIGKELNRTESAIVSRIGVLKRREQ
jgi:hypothetical protein